MLSGDYLLARAERKNVKTDYITNSFLEIEPGACKFRKVFPFSLGAQCCLPANNDLTSRLKLTLETLKHYTITFGVTYNFS
jgi:hypothetical protein